jgi:hypothetical protein
MDVRFGKTGQFGKSITFHFANRLGINYIGNWSHRVTSTMITEDDQTKIEEEEEEMSSAFGEPSEKEEDERDEVKEVHKLAQKETARVRMGKLLVLVSILATAALVSTGTYIFLKKEEDDDYNDSVSFPICTALTPRLNVN